MKKLSVIIITFNEERNIESCLNSVVELADEILILDSNSTDSTSQLIQNYPFPIRFFESQFLGYGYSKNKLESLADGDYIFSIDADEVVSNQLKTSILNEKESGFPFAAYQLKRENIYCGKAIRHGSWNPDIKMRIWKKGVAKWDLSEVHENLIIREGTETRLLNGPLLHYSYRTREEHVLKGEKYAKLGAVQLHRLGKKAHFWKLIFSPIFRFFRDYIFKMGFLDGKNGWIIAWLSAKEVFLKYKTLRQLEQSSLEQKLN